MALKALSDGVIKKIVSMHKAGQSYREIGAELNVSWSVVAKYARKYSREKGVDRSKDGHQAGVGPPDDPVNAPIDDRNPDGGETRIVTPDKPLTIEQMIRLFNIDTKKWIPQHLRANQWQGFYKLKGEAGGHRKVMLWQTRVSWKRIIAEDVENAILEFTRKNVKPLPKGALSAVKQRAKAGKGFALSWGIWDAHLGMYAWREEVGANFDISIARNRILNSVDDMAAELDGYRIDQIWMPIGNDFMHFDNVRQKTTHGEHHLDADGRYGKVYLAALECLSYMVERALEISDKIDLMYVPGNHDLTSAFTLCVALAQRFKNERRVKVDTSFNPRKYRRYGGTLLGFDHGESANAKQLALVMPSETGTMWHGSTYREIQVGHTHQRRETEIPMVVPTNGVTVRTNPCLSNVDAWHHKSALIGELAKSVEAWRYDENGYRGSHCVWARDDDNRGKRKAA